MVAKSSVLLVLLGVALVVVAPFVGVSHAKPKRVLLKDSVAVEFEEVSVLSFRVDSARAGYLVRIYVNVTDVFVGPKSYRPILDIVVVDQQGLDLLESNQTANYVYVKALAIQNPILLTANDIRRAGEYYVVFTNRFPVSANVPIIVTDEWDEWTVNMLFYLLMIIGAAVAVFGAVWIRVARQIKASRAR